MPTAEKFHPQYITDEQGNRVSVVLPVAEYEELLEEIDVLAAVAERKDEQTITHESLLAALAEDWRRPEEDEAWRHLPSVAEAQGTR